ncbi:ANTAR domain-containing protein [Candidatus Roizmanbacteria bacterium]|nr:ANTAR domain-containing protein [Candidatus Roizmanbacteria bacterium]
MLNSDAWIKIINLLSELVVFDTQTFESFLRKLIKIVAQVIPTDSCFIYIMDREDGKLTLVGSKRSHKNLLGKIDMQPGEGITGWVAAHKKSVVLTKEAYRDERFKAFKELPEDQFEAFLSVPILDKKGVIGVINIQNKEVYNFTQEQIDAVEAIVKVVSSGFEKNILDKKVNYLENKLEERKVVEKAKGLLMKAKKISESEAYAFIRKEAMKKRKTMKEIAEATLLVYG